ncbi:putative small nuclear ribonucleoprotein Sm D3 [Pseudoloma neurophilia]|uniref:Putative small nuclear ribonucleoprotein Sm D3 n=1 Tax=Pseudoloma neurophilia TaxID=146866 RepID=A0A0R0LZQ5_9MICR|nr:putative small nuclear ribonucleoprotein Sm D3 [Pseudoloma neurophilia]
MTISVPLKVLYDCQGLQITLETEKDVITGKLFQIDDCINITIDDAIITNFQGVKTKIDRILVKGSMIQFIVLPPILEYSPHLQRKPTESIE